jgi:hypothetical protein
MMIAIFPSRRMAGSQEMLFLEGPQNASGQLRSQAMGRELRGAGERSGRCPQPVNRSLSNIPDNPRAFFRPSTRKIG